MRRHLPAIAAMTAALVLATAGPALAHVDLEPTEAMAGTEVTLTFSFHHGKDGTATTALEVAIPEGVRVVEVPAVPGWTSETVASAATVRWSGGRVPDGTRAAFPLVVRLPSTPGVLRFPTIQETEAGELAWIEDEEGSAEGDFPAPRLLLTPNPAAATTTTAVETATTAAPSTTERRAGTTVEAQQRDEGNTDMAPWLIGSGIAAAVAVGAGGLLLKRRTG